MDSFVFLFVLSCLCFYLCSVFSILGMRIIFTFFVTFFCLEGFYFIHCFFFPCQFHCKWKLFEKKKRFVLDLEWFQCISFKFLGFWNFMPFYYRHNIFSAPSIRINVLQPYASNEVRHFQKHALFSFLFLFLFLLLFCFIIKFLSGTIFFSRFYILILLYLS